MSRFGRLHILFLTNLPSPYKVDFYNEMLRYADVTVFYEKNRMPSRDEKWVADTSMKYEAIFGNGISTGDESAFAPSVLKEVRKDKYDIVVISYYSSLTEMLAANYLKRHHIPYAFHTDGGIIKQDSKLQYYLKHKYIGGATMWLSTGESVTDYLVHYGANKDKCYIYPFTSVKEEDVLKEPVSKEEKTELREKLGIKEDKVIISVGQFIYRKGYDILLKAIMNKALNAEEPMTSKTNTTGVVVTENKPNIKDIGIYLIGGDPTQEYNEILKDYSYDNIHFIPFMSKSDLSEYYKAADLFVLPTREDIWGLVINEAMSFGLPVITTDKCVAGVEMIDGNGKVVPIETDWAEEIADFFSIKELNDGSNSIARTSRTEMSRKSLEIAKDYTIEKMALSQYQYLEQFYDENHA